MLHIVTPYICVTAKLISWKTILCGVCLVLAIVWANTDCYQLGLCHSKSLPSVSHFVGREEDIHNITGYLDFSTSDVQVVHIVGPPGFGKSTLAMKIGEIFVRKWVKVFYVDLRTVKNIDSMAEKTMLSIVDSMQNKVRLSRLKKWVGNQYSKTLIILDNCDELFEREKEEFLDVIASLASSRKSVKYLLTSQKWVADIDNFQLHAIYNLSSKAAVNLLGKVAPSVTDGQKWQIADLTGNVPLALKIVGAIFVFPDAPTPEVVIDNLKDNLVATLSSDDIGSKVDVCINTAYNYLTPELKQLCVNLSCFPGDFDKESATFIFNFKSNMLTTLVRRSLLQYDRGGKRYYFHQLLQEFFIQRNTEKSDVLQQHFSLKFQLYFAQFICQIIPENGKNLQLERFFDEELNIIHMFLLFTSHRHVNNTFYAIKVISHELRMVILSRFLPPGVCLIMLDTLVSYTPSERASVESFLETYAQVAIHAIRSKENINATIWIEVEEGYKQRTLSLKTYTKFYSTLAEYFKEKGNDSLSVWCHTHVLRVTSNQLQHCYPDCDYFSISVAYENIGNRERAFHYRKLAYDRQNVIEPMDGAKLIIHLYNDYLDKSLGNDIAKARNLSATIREEIYPYLLVAEKSEYSEEVYFAAIKFFKAQNMDEHAIGLQRKMFDMFKTLDKCSKDNANCSNYYASVISKSMRNQCYYLAALLAKEGFSPLPKTLYLSYIIGKSLYSLGNYSESQYWLTISLKLVNDALQKRYSSTYRDIRCGICYYLIMSGNLTNIPCYGYIIKDTMSSQAAIIVHEIHEKYVLGKWKEPEIPPTEPALTAETLSFIWYELADRLEYALKHKWENVKRQTSFISAIIKQHSLILSCFSFIFSPFIIAISLVCIIAEFMHTFCSEKQIACCMSCFSLCICLSIFNTVTIYLFVIFLDLLY